MNIPGSGEGIAAEAFPLYKEETRFFAVRTAETVPAWKTKTAFYHFVCFLSLTNGKNGCTIKYMKTFA